MDLPVLIPLPIVRRPEPDDEPTPPSPAVLQARAVIASILGSLRDGPHLPDSGLHWAAAYLSRDERPTESRIVVATTDAGWLPNGVLIPTGVRVLWNTPIAAAWSTVDDPVRQLIVYSREHGYTVRGIATTHPGRVHYDPADPGRLVGESHLGPVIDGGATRFEVVASAARVARIRAVDPEHAQRQIRALLRDLERLTVEPGLIPGLDESVAEAGRYLHTGQRVPASVLGHLNHADDELVDALRERRRSPRDVSADGPPPSSAHLRGLLVQRATVEATRAAIATDVESAVFAWTFARYLARR